VEFRQLSICQYGEPSRPCQTLTTLENPPRYIKYGEVPARDMLTRPTFVPHTPPRSPHRRSGSHHRYSGEYTSDDGHRRPRRDSGLAAALLDGKKLRQHRRERIVIVDRPPTPRTPPQIFTQAFTAPSSPAAPAYIVDTQIGRGRPIIVDERPPRRERALSIGAVVGERLLPRKARSQSRPRHEPPVVLASFSERSRRREEEEREEREERRRRRNEREEREAEREIERRRAEKIALQNEEILRRPAVPMPPVRRLSERIHLKPVVDQSRVLQTAMGALSLEERVAELAAERRRREERESLIRARLAAERQAEEEEAMRQRLKERQMPTRRFSVGPGHRRHRVIYDDGLYRWE